MKIEIIGIWDGRDMRTIVQILSTKNTELRIRKQGKKLILKDKSVEFYKCVSAGDHVEVPVYANSVVEDLEEEDNEKLRCDCCNSVLTEEQKATMIEWGRMCIPCDTPKIYQAETEDWFCPTCEKS